MRPILPDSVLQIQRRRASRRPNRALRVLLWSGAALALTVMLVGRCS
jgi:hypothetical protein